MHVDIYIYPYRAPARLASIKLKQRRWPLKKKGFQESCFATADSSFSPFVFSNQPNHE